MTLTTAALARFAQCGYKHLLVDIEGMSYEEAAVAANIPVGTVKSRLARARTQMRQVLRPYQEPFCVSYQVGFPVSMKV